MPKIPDHLLGGGPEGFLFSNSLVSRSMMLNAVTIRSPKPVGLFRAFAILSLATSDKFPRNSNIPKSF